MVTRTDQATDPAVRADLATVRLGTAAFRRALGRLTDDDFDAPSGLPGWTRSHVVAHVGYNARAVARLVTWAATGVEHAMYSSPEARAQEIELGATLRPQALRSLCEHAAIELDVRWRDLPDERWAEVVVTAQGRRVPASETLWIRTREVWLHAVDLRAGMRVRDLPKPVLRRLLDDVAGLWARRGQLDGLRLVETNDERQFWGADQDVRAEVSGDLPSLVTWATGRGSSAVSWPRGASPRPAPHWI